MTAFWRFCSPCPPPPKNSKHVHSGRVFWVWVCLLTSPLPYHTFKTQKTQSKWLGFIIIPPISSSQPENSKHVHFGRVLGLGGLVYLSPYIPHLHNPRNPVRNDRVLDYCLIPHPFPPPPENSKHVHYGRIFCLRVTSFTFPHAYYTSRTQKTRSKWPGLWCSASYPPISSPSSENGKHARPYGMCFLSSDGFVYLPPCLLHVQNTKAQSKWPGLWSHTPTYPLPHRKMENTPIWDVFSELGWVRLPSPMHTPPLEQKKPGPNGRVYGVLPHTPTYPLPHPKMENMPIWDVVSGFGWLRLPSSIYNPPPQPKKPSHWLFWVPHSPPISPPHLMFSAFGYVCLPSPTASFPTWKWKACLIWTCFLCSNVFAYILLCLPYVLPQVRNDWVNWNKTDMIAK